MTALCFVMLYANHMADSRADFCTMHMLAEIAAVLKTAQDLNELCQQENVQPVLCFENKSCTTNTYQTLNCSTVTH